MISAVPRDYRAFANSAAQTFANLFGYLPSPFLYGMIIKYTGGPKSRWGMGLLMFWSFWGLIGLALAYRADRAKRRQDKAKKESKKKTPKTLENGAAKNKTDGIEGNPPLKEVEIVQSNLKSEEGTPYVSRFESKFDKFSLSNDHIHKMEYSIEHERFSSERVRFSSDIGKSTPLLGAAAKQRKGGDMSGSAQLIGGTMHQGRFRKVLYSSQHPVRNNSMFNFSFNPNIMVNFPLPEKLRTKRVSFSEKVADRNLFHSSREPQGLGWERENMDIKEEDERNNVNETSQISDNNAKEIKGEKK